VLGICQKRLNWLIAIEVKSSTHGLVIFEVPFERILGKAIIGWQKWMHWDIPSILDAWSEDILVAEMAKIGFFKRR